MKILHDPILIGSKSCYVHHTVLVLLECYDIIDGVSSSIDDMTSTIQKY